MAAPAARSTIRTCSVAFLVLPALMAFQRMLAGRLSAALGGGVILLVMLTALLLSFSRAAWGQFAVAALLLMGMMFATSRAPSERLRMVLIAMGGTLVTLFLLSALLLIGQIADLFKERATRDQNYDLGRFGRYILGFDLMLDRPLGIGVLQFSKSYFSEDPHNTFLNTFMSGGWLGGLAYLALTFVTAVRGLRFVFVRTPWQPTYHVVYAAFLGIAGESAIIDIDHWRHYFLILGVLWGLMAATTIMRRTPLRARARGRRSSASSLSAERSAARLAHQSGGLGVASSNLAAPTRENIDRTGHISHFSEFCRKRT